MYYFLSISSFNTWLTWSCPLHFPLVMYFMTVFSFYCFLFLPYELRHRTRWRLDDGTGSLFGAHQV